METENNITIPFLFTSVTRDSDSPLTTNVCRKPTHTGQYLAYDLHHPQSVKQSIVKCLYDQAKHLITKPSTTAKVKKYLSSVLVSNEYPSSFVQKITKTKKPTAKEEPTQDSKSTAVVLYIKGSLLLPTTRRTHCFKSGTMLRLHQTCPKEVLDSSKQDGAVYKFLCKCSKVYIGETGRAMHERIKEHDRERTYPNLCGFRTR